MFYGKNVIPIIFLGTLLLLIILANRRNIEEIYKKY